jgi:hypothetical protein
MTAALVGATVIALTASAQAGPTGTDSFTLTGSITGTIADVSSACAASASAPDVQFVWYGTVTTLSGITTKSIVDVEVDLAGKGYGKSGHLSHRSLRKTPFVTFAATNANPEIPNPIWRAYAGTYSTTAQGAGGTVDVKLKETQTRHPHGELTLSGSWTDCATAPGT